MSITTDWGEGKRSVHIEFVGDWLWDEFEVNTRQAEDLLNTIAYNADTIFDFTEAGSPPSGIMAHFEDLLNSHYFHHPNSGKVIVVGSSKFIEMLVNAFSSFSKYSIRISVVDTLEEAYNIVAD